MILSRLLHGFPRTFNESDFNQMGGVDPVTLSGFTTYNCSVIASTSAGNGLAAMATATTEEDCKHFKYKLSYDNAMYTCAAIVQ